MIKRLLIAVLLVQGLIIYGMDDDAATYNLGVIHFQTPASCYKMMGPAPIMQKLLVPKSKKLEKELEEIYAPIKKNEQIIEEKMAAYINGLKLPYQLELTPRQILREKIIKELSEQRQKRRIGLMAQCNEELRKHGQDYAIADKENIRP